MVQYWLSLSPDNQVQIITALVTVLPIVAGAVISIMQITSAKKREIEAKVHQQRKEKYEQLISIIRRIFTNMGDIEKGKMPFKQEEWIDLQFNLAMYASSPVYQQYIRFRKKAEDKKGLEGMVELANLILLMRKEIGFSDSNISIRDVLGTFINDIEDTKYDGLFKTA